LTRPFIEFLQCQSLPWSKGVPGGGLANLESKILSQDDADGATTALLRLPPAWSAGEGVALACEEELFVLCGSLCHEGVAVGALEYLRLPAGSDRSSLGSDETRSTVVVSFTTSEWVTSPVRTDALGAQAVRTHEEPWTGNFHPQFPPGAGRKFLKQDPETGEQTWLLGTLPLRWGSRAERHPVVEEMFLVSGTLVSPLGTMFPGAYFWRPPEEWHGPFGTFSGNLELFRTVGGPLSTEYRQHPEPLDRHPDYSPVLPPDLLEPATQGHRFCQDHFSELNWTWPHLGVERV